MKILIIRFVEIGDVVITSAICTTLKHSLSSSEIHYLTYEVSASLFKYHRDIDQVLTISSGERKNPLKYINRAWSISRNKYDVIIDATSTTKSEFISLFSRSTPIRVGRLKPNRGFFYTHNVSREILCGDKLSQRIALLNPLRDLGYKISAPAAMRLFVSEQERLNLTQRMKLCGVDFDRPVFIFGVSAKFSEKKWCFTQMTDVIIHCIDKYKAQIVLFAGLPHEQGDVDQIHSMLNHHESVFSNIKIDGLRELAALIFNGDIYIGNEGGPRHIAHALGLPTASVFSPSASIAEWLPCRGSKHQGVEWRNTRWQDVIDEKSIEDVEYEYGDTNYHKLYKNIKAENFIPVVDDVVNAAQIL